MSGARGAGDGVAVSDRLAQLAADPEGVDDLPREDVPDVLSEVEALRARLWARLTRPERNGGPPQAEDNGADRLLTVEELAEVLNVDERYVYRRADRWPFTVRLSERKLRFSEEGLQRWLRTR